MSVRATTAVLDHSESRGSARVVMLVLADHSDDYGFSWPGVERLSHKSRVTPRAVQKHLANLKKTELNIYPRKGRANVYQLLLPGLLAIDAEETIKLKEWGVKVSSGVKDHDAKVHPNHKEHISSKEELIRDSSYLDSSISSMGSPERLGQEPSRCGNCKAVLDADSYCWGCGLVWIAS